MEPLDQLRRLHALRPQRATPEATPAHSSTHSGAANEDRYGDASPSERALERLVPGAVVETEVGACYGTSDAYPRQELRGVFALGDLLPRRPGLLAPFHPVARLDESPDFAGAVFLDTETTGLGAAPSVYAFMVGVGTYEMIAQPGATVAEAHYVVRQFFMRSPGEEPALLVALADLLRDRTLMVSFNGRSFDLPLLRTRGILCRRRGLLDDLAGLDLLPVARRLWGRRLPDCRQATVEVEAGCTHRGADDIPGHLIPAAWWNFVRRGETGTLREVCEHNLWDLQGMAAILDAAIARSRLLDEPPAPRSLPWQDAWSLARLCERRADAPLEARSAAAAWIVAALPDAARQEAPPRFYADAVRILKRVRDWERVGALLAECAQRHGPSPWAHLEAAILYEHRLGDPRRALAHALELGDEHRAARLRARLVDRSLLDD